jgi:hypothetical protein
MVVGPIISIYGIFEFFKGRSLAFKGIMFFLTGSLVGYIGYTNWILQQTAQ